MAIQTISFQGRDLSANSFEIASGKEAVRQRLVQRLRTWRGEWLMDTSIGVPYLSEVFVRPPVLAPNVIAREERRVTDVESVATTEFVQVDDPADRRYRVSIIATTVDQDEIALTETLG